MQFEELICSQCQRQYSNTGPRIPRFLTQCGHTFCTQCLNHFLQSSQGEFYCPEDNVLCTRKASAEEYPKNLALLRLVEKQGKQKAVPGDGGQQSQTSTFKEKFEDSKGQQHHGQEELCKTHQRKLEIICIDDRERICSNCALFGSHKNHEIKLETEVLGEIEVRTEYLIEIYDTVESNPLFKVDKEAVEGQYKRFQAKSADLKQQVEDKFKEIEASLKIQKHQTEQVLSKNCAYIESQFKLIRDVPSRLLEDSDRWLGDAKSMLDSFTKNSSNSNFIAFDMLEYKNAPPVGNFYQTGQDIISSGEKLLAKLDGQKHVSEEKIELMLEQMDLKFDKHLIKNLNEICKSQVVEGAEGKGEVGEFQEQQKDELDIKNMQSALKKGVTVVGDRPRPSHDEEDLLEDVSMMVSSQNSPFMTKKSSELKRGSTVKQPRSLKEEEDSILYPAQKGVEVLQACQQSDNGEDLLGPLTEEEKEVTIPDDLIQEIENYLKDVMEQNEKVIDISDTPIGNYGAACIAAVLSLCEQLEEIRLGNCGIKDEGAINLFDELKNSSTSVKLLDLSKNPITEKSFGSLAAALEQNKNIQCVEITGIKADRLTIANNLGAWAKKITF